MNAMSILNVVEKPYKFVIVRITGWDLRKLTKRIIILGVILSLVGSYFWYNKLYMTNERKFWSAINNSLSTKSVTRSIKSGGSGNEVLQSQRFAFAPQMASESKVRFNQKSALVDTTVVTEGVLFPDAQYSRYVAFSTNQTKSDGTTPTLENIIGKWEANVVAESDLEQAKLTYVSELVTLVMFGNYSADFRQDLLTQLKSGNVYAVNYDDVKEDEVNGEKADVYLVSVGLKEYARQLQRAFVVAGYGEFPPLDPDNYREDSRINARFFVSQNTNSIIGVGFGSREESYSGYGINRTIVRPKTFFGPGELERIVQEEIQGIL